MTQASGIPPNSLPRGKLDFYQEELRLPSGGDPRSRLRRPAIALLAVTLISLLLISLGTLAMAWHWITSENFEAGMGALGLLLVAVLHLVTILGLISAITLRNYFWAWFGVGLSAVPCGNALAITWLPLLLTAWAVLGLLTPETRKLFQK
ncbi:MAG: hypothetical protein WD045_07190 [Pirellulaceae bacterium]